MCLAFSNQHLRRYERLPLTSFSAKNPTHFERDTVLCYRLLLCGSQDNRAGV